MKTLADYQAKAIEITRDYFDGFLTFDEAYQACSDAGIVMGPAPWHSAEFRGYVPAIEGMIAFGISQAA